MELEDFDTSTENAEEIHFKTTGDRDTDDWRVDTLYRVKKTGAFVLYVETGMDESEGMGASWGETMTKPKAREWLKKNGGAKLVAKYFKDR